MSRTKHARGIGRWYNEQRQEWRAWVKENRRRAERRWRWLWGDPE